MTTQSEPITPPVRLVEEWIARSSGKFDLIAQWAARWGADQELEACCGWIESLRGLGGLLTSAKFRCMVSDRLRAARRPELPSLKQQAIEAIEREAHVMQPASISILRQALATLP